VRYLITGGGGFIGSHLTRRLARAGETIALVKPGSANSLRLAPGIGDVQVLSVDIRDGAAVRRTMGDVRPTAVCHLAAAGLVPGAPPALVTATNVLGTYNVLAAIRATTTVDRAVFAGSWYEYGSASVEDRARIPRPNSVYGISKLAATQLVQECAARSGIPFVVVRPFQVYGPGESPHRLIPDVLRQSDVGVPVRLQNPGAQRDWVHVEDVVEAFESVLAANVSGKIIDIGTGVVTSVHEVVRKVLFFAGRITDGIEQASDSTPSDSDDGRLSGAANAGLAQELLGWKARYDLATGLRKTVDWYRQNGQWNVKTL